MHSEKNETADDLAFCIINTTADEIIKYQPELNLNDIQKDVLDLFEKNSYTILQSEFSDYMRARQLFAGAAVESVNEICFDLLDDVLIEEEDEYLTINQEYFKKLLTHD
ncbi:tellurite resistance TerB C-terminal domain-containing protein [Chryseobacterium sp. JJR-5R]|uniref:tellurite resistance TerB C-terminal domain-containing protein n=1 Tax=Chryseobacterium sp. JJR-5R TaxID=3093923 RepID=UPI002A750749|nr:tellurite resistance TerB C-terminal domain-containing protein [Chryseobacterium sp. JJR-5R]WPO84552.1 tellurite resistance TerB C-terminal domain-containing protein [Chryseobacterium sp. JJR-5R]